LQVCDVVINGPIKSHIRAAKALDTYLQFKEFQTLFFNSPTKEQMKLKLKPVKTDVSSGIKTLRSHFDDRTGDLATIEFKSNISKSFVDTYR
jgi:hypothetical protein